jgi:hypothetical protein
VIINDASSILGEPGEEGEEEEEGKKNEVGRDRSP